MGNAQPTGSQDSGTGCIYGSATEQVNGMIALKQKGQITNRRTTVKEASSTKRVLRQHLYALKIPRGKPSPKENRNLNSILMKSILAQDWKAVLIRARLHPEEVPVSSIVVVPIPQTDSSPSIRCHRMKILPIHAACALGGPPEVVKALLSYKLVRNPNGRTHKAGRATSYGGKSTPMPLFHENNSSLAAASVELVGHDYKKITETIQGKLSSVRVKAMDIGNRFHNKHQISSKRRIACKNETKTEEMRSNHELEYPRWHKDERQFLRQMEDHLASNARGIIQKWNGDNDPKACTKNSSIFVLDFDPSCMLPSPSTVRASEKQQPFETVIPRNHEFEDLFSIENSIGDMDTVMTTESELRLDSKHEDHDESSSSLEYLMDDTDSSSASSHNIRTNSIFRNGSGVMCGPTTNNYDGARRSPCKATTMEPNEIETDSDTDASYLENNEDNDSFLQLTTDGGLAVHDIRSSRCCPNRSAIISCKKENNFKEGRSTPTSHAENYSTSDESDSETSGSSTTPDCATVVKQSISIGFDCELIIQSLSKRKEGKSESKSIPRLLPIHIACLYEAPASVLRVLLDEYPESATVEFLGMLPVHMVAAQWSVPGNHAEFATTSFEHGNENTSFRKDRLYEFVDSNPNMLVAKSTAHNLLPVDYINYSLARSSVELEHGLMKCKEYLDSQVQDGESLTTSYDDKIDSVSTCTTSVSTFFNDGGSSLLGSFVNEQSHHIPFESKKNITLGSLLKNGHWDAAKTMLENDPDTAKAHSSFQRASKDHSGTISRFEWTGLPIHIICHGFKIESSFSNNLKSAVPIGLVDLLVSSYPDGLKHSESYSGSLPLHIICDSFRRHDLDSMGSGGFGGEKHREFLSVRLEVLQRLLKSYPFASRMRDRRGRLPLHRAILANAPFEAIRLLVYRDPRAIACSDGDGTTPFSLAKQLYSAESAVVRLFKDAWIT